jgi:hypothetical protein
VNDVSVGSCVFLVSISCASEWGVHAALTLMAGRHPNSQANTRNYILLVQHDECTCHSGDDSKAMPWWSSHSAHQGTRVKKKRYGWLLRDALTTQFHFGPRFSAIQPPSELIPKTLEDQVSICHSLRVPAILQCIAFCTYGAFFGTRHYSQLQAHTIVCSYTEHGTDDAQRGLHLRHRSRRAHTTQDLTTTEEHTPCAILSKCSHYAQQQPPPFSSQTSNLSSRPYPYQSPTTSHRLLGSHLKSNNTTHPRKRHITKHNHTTTSSADKTTTPARQATTTVRTSARQVFAVHLVRGAVPMRRDM